MKRLTSKVIHFKNHENAATSVWWMKKTIHLFWVLKTSAPNRVKRDYSNLYRVNLLVYSVLSAYQLHTFPCFFWRRR